MTVPRDRGSVSSLNVAPGCAKGNSVHTDICRLTLRFPVGEARKLLVRWTEKTAWKRKEIVSWIFLGLNSPGNQTRD